MKRILNISLLIAAGILVFTSCVKDLDTVPLDKDEVTAASVYEDTTNYTKVLAKLYAGLAVSGQIGPNGAGDISGIDEGFGQYLRGYWYHQELTTDESVMAWNDQTIKDLHWQTWGTSDVFIAAMYYRIFYQVSICNEYIRETSESKLSERGISGDLRAKIGFYRAEARFLRALSYWHALDLFGNVPF
ncbi:MAG TPA: RagB/SusD family nutrient uptake outer membrane protein, partial [Bacteroidales bacterium]|nr:RagB/SusD family nutrient uptake outer membrane protein [Bacteroidales bacterium]